MVGLKERSNTTRTKNTTLKDKPKSTVKKRKIKKIPRLNQTKKTKYSKTRKKFYQQIGGKGVKKYPQPNEKSN